jgi:hypothetical protein
MGKDLERNGLGIIDVVSRNLPGVTEGSHKQLRLEYPAEIQSEHLPNAVLQKYTRNNGKRAAQRFST